MWGTKQIIPFRDFMSGSYKKKAQKIQRYHSLSPLAFVHMSDPILNTYLALGIMGTALIGAVMLERYLVQNDYVSAAKLLSDGIHYGVRMGGVGFIGYTFIRIVIMF
ncbi:hypothetical protein [Bacillus thuringiensis]|uniref:Uncharacterized protein n=1 Tax=Bacillus thuringiensis DB27 TaxID=1431339 RepID=W8YA27_BACTU|nr:hypothetical protein [Bacillus thuringiensis]MBG9669378.1 hypothetical protein [Bacillus thuringiensis]MBH0355671.1 hypothetical protein [Bacillus thuringiensis]CDN38364.1 unnamed protein product [Bacillus thuringiensis DB27]